MCVEFVLNHFKALLPFCMNGHNIILNNRIYICTQLYIIYDSHGYPYAWLVLTGVNIIIIISICHKLFVYVYIVKGGV